MMKKTDETAGRNPFRVPDGYFEEVNRRIIAATIENHTMKRSGWRIIPGLRPYLLAAASLAGVIVLTYAAYLLLRPEESMNGAGQAYYDEHFYPEMDELDIYSLEENLEPFAVTDNVPDVSKADIIEYLMTDNIEIGEIYEQL